jgi:hypothetical protein
MNSQASWSAERKHATGSSTDVSLDVGRSAVHPDTFGHLKNARARRLGGLEAPLELVPIDGPACRNPLGCSDFGWMNPCARTRSDSDTQQRAPLRGSAAEMMSCSTVQAASLSGPNGLGNRAYVYFGEVPTNILGVVTNVDQPNFDGLTAYAFLRRPDFAEWYDILRNEKPLSCFSSYAGPEYAPNQPNRVLNRIELYTGQPEPPGEGAEEVQANLFPAEILAVLRGEA